MLSLYSSSSRRWWAEKHWLELELELEDFYRFYNDQITSLFDLQRKIYIYVRDCMPQAVRLGWLNLDWRTSDLSADQLTMMTSAMNAFLLRHSSVLSSDYVRLYSNLIKAGCICRHIMQQYTLYTIQHFRVCKCQFDPWERLHAIVRLEVPVT